MKSPQRHISVSFPTVHGTLLTDTDTQSSSQTWESKQFHIKTYYDSWQVDSIISIKPFRLVFANITDHDNQGKITQIISDALTGASIIDRNNPARFWLIIMIIDSQEGHPWFLSQSFQFCRWITGPNSWHNKNLEYNLRSFLPTPSGVYNTQGQPTKKKLDSMI